MKVVLQENVSKLGAKGEIKEVKQGFYYNYLLPRNKAVIATEKMVREVQAKEKRKKRQKTKLLEQARELAKKLKGQKIRIEKSVTKKKLLFAQVKPADIISAVRKKFKIKKGLLSPKAIDLPEIIKKPGRYSIVLRLAPEIETEIELIVAAKK